MTLLELAEKLQRRADGFVAVTDSMDKRLGPNTDRSVIREEAAIYKAAAAACRELVAARSREAQIPTSIDGLRENTDTVLSECGT